MPGCVIDSDMDVTDARRYGKCAVAKDWHHPHVFRTVLNKDAVLSYEAVGF